MRTLSLLLFGLLAMGCGARSVLQPGGDAAEGGVSGGGAIGGAAEVGGAGGAGATGTGTVVSTGVGAAGGGGAGGGGSGMNVVEACVLAVSCGHSGGWMGFTPSSCVDGFSRLGWRFDPPGQLPDPDIAQLLLDCAAKSEGDCTAFQACFGGDWVGLSRCREGGNCTGNTLTASIEGPSFDCGAIGAQCAILWSNAERACCNAEPCPQTTPIECNGTVASYCGGWGERVTFDCGPSGRKCNAGSSDLWTPCVGDAPCDPMAPVTCEGDVAVYCSGGGLAKQDCSKTGFRTACNGGASSWDVACKPKGVACDPTFEPSTCDGKDIRVCVDGEWVTVPCSVVKAGNCEEQPDGARCVF